MRISFLHVSLMGFILLISPTLSFCKNKKKNNPPLPTVSKDKEGKLPSDLLKELFNDYRSQNFYSASQITTGKMGKAISNLYALQKSYGGKLPKNQIGFYEQLTDMKIVGQTQYKDASIVRTLWILHLPEKYNKNIFYTKIHYIDYFLRKDSKSSWKISDAKFLQEHVLYNPLPKL